MILFSVKSSVFVQCTGNQACLSLHLYCPQTAECQLYCDGDSDPNSPCDGADIYIADPDNSYDESLLTISCDSGECLMYENWCIDMEYESCSRSSFMTLTPLNCTADTEHCQVRNPLII